MTDAMVSSIQAKEMFSELLLQVWQQKERIIITKRGVPIAALIPIEEFQRLQADQDHEDVRAAIASLHEAREGGMTTLRDLLYEKDTKEE